MSKNKTIKITGKISQYLVAGSLIISGALKLIGLPQYIDMINDLSPNYAVHIHLLGILAITSGVLFLLKKTQMIGFIITLVFLGGTIAAHMQHNDPFIPQIVFVLLTVFVVYSQKPEWFTISE